MIGYVYLTTNLINNKKYIGRRTSEVFLDTKYLGSGIHLLNAVKKYGKENYELVMEMRNQLHNAIKKDLSL